MSTSTNNSKTPAQMVNALLKRAETMFERCQFSALIEKVHEKLGDYPDRMEWAIEMIEKIAYRNHAILKEKDWIRSVMITEVTTNGDSVEFKASCEHLSFEGFAEGIGFNIPAEAIRHAEELKSWSKSLGDYDETDDYDEIFEFVSDFDKTQKPEYVKSELHLIYHSKLKYLRN